MHEIGLVDDILCTVNAKLKASNSQKVDCINIAIGELEHVTPEHFEFHFRERVRNTHLEGVKLNFKKVEARFRCKGCGCEFSVEEGMTGCPRCKSRVNDIISGSGIYVESVEISEMKSGYYQGRFYRKWVNAKDLITNEVIVKETDLLVSAEKDIKETAKGLVEKYRGQIEDYIGMHPDFKTSLEPLKLDSNSSDIIKEMMLSSSLAGVGPMASVAGAVAEFVGKGLLRSVKEVIVENGGDIFIKTDIGRTIAIYAGESPLTNKLFIKIKPEETPLGICTSSGTVGHSLSFGKADACVIISKSTSLADAVATAACNKVRRAKDIKNVLKFALSVKGIRGALIIYKKDFGVSGEIELA